MAVKKVDLMASLMVETLAVYLADMTVYMKAEKLVVMMVRMMVAQMVA